MIVSYKYHKWIVFTTIQAPTEAFTRLLNQHDWNIVVVGDTKTPIEIWRQKETPPRVVFLSFADQKRLWYSIIPLIPPNSYARKNIGYLYAIEHGAQFIYETDDDNLLIADLNDLIDIHVNTHTQTKRRFLNPYEYFDQPLIHPRGYPLGQRRVEQVVCACAHANCPLGSITTTINDDGNALIRQTLANGDPDVDAIFRISQPMGKINVEFSDQHIPLSIPSHTYTPFNSQTIAFAYDAFFAMMMPMSTSFRVCDIWRSFWAQRLLWEIGGHVAFYKPFVAQDRNVHNYSIDFALEKDLYDKTSALVFFLEDEWKDSESATIGNLAIDLSQKMWQHGFWGETDYLLASAWIMDLKRMTYLFPPLRVTNVASVSTGTSVSANTNNNTLFCPPGVIDGVALVVSFFNDDCASEQSEFIRFLYGRWFTHIYLIGRHADVARGVVRCELDDINDCISHIGITGFLLIEQPSKTCFNVSEIAHHLAGDVNVHFGNGVSFIIDSHGNYRNDDFSFPIIDLSLDADRIRCLLSFTDAQYDE